MSTGSAAEAILDRRSVEGASIVDNFRRRGISRPPFCRGRVDCRQFPPPGRFSTEGASIVDWFKRWKQNDLNRIAQAVQRGAIEELSVDEVAANVWNACAVSHNSARTVARTIINGVSNAARIETLLANDDVIDGIEFLATLDGRTSHICGALDGTVWRGEEMKRARRPSLHPNCRSTLIPVVDLIDPETGEKIEETARRPAKNADGSYSQVDAKTTFKDYFESQPESFQRAWLGEKRFELWKSGKLKFEDLAKPATSYRATTDDLTPPEEPPKPEPAPVADSPRLTGAAKSFVETLRARRQKTLSADEAAAIEAQESVYAAQRVAAAEANRNARNLEAEFREVNLQALREKDPAKKKELDELEAKTLRALAQARKEAEAAIDAAETAERERAGTIDVDAFLSALFGDDGDGENVFDDDKIAAIEKIFDAQGVGGAARPILERYNRIARYLGFSEADKDWKKYGFEELGQVLFVDLPENAGGEYDDNNCCINLNANGLKTRREASSSFAHEVGHWFELRVLGVDSAIKTEEWLRDAINAPPRRSDKELDRLGSTFWALYDLRRCDVTFWRPDYYAAREYSTFSGNDYNYTPYRPTEVMSTAFEGLLTDPEAFARSSPEQFNRVIQAFEDFRKARSKNVDKPNKAPRSADAKAQAPQADEEFDLAASSEGLAQRFKRLAVFSSSSKAATEAREKLKIDADYSKIPRDVAEEMNKELEKALEKFGSFGFVEKIEALDRTNALGSYDGKKGIIKLRPDLDLDGLKDEMEKSFKDDPRAYATRSRRHALRHEIGHAIMQAVKNKHFDTMGRLSELETQWEEREKKLKKLCREVLDNPALASTRAMANQFELVAEAFAVALLDDFEKKVIFKGGKKELAVKDAFAAKVILTLIGAL